MIEILALCGFAFFAGLVDAIAGGGGLIQVPALFAVYPSAPPALLLGTNKFASAAGTAVVALRYGWSIPIRWGLVLPVAVVACVGAFMGAKTVTLLDPGALRHIVLVMLGLVAIYTVARRGFGLRPGNDATQKAGSLGVSLLALVVGFYDGFLGPGTGSFLMFGLMRLFGYDFLGATATTKVLNLATNFGALILFVMTDNVLYTIGLPMAASNIAGGVLGAQLALKKGNRFIRAVFLVVLVALMGKLALDLVMHD